MCCSQRFVFFSLVDQLYLFIRSFLTALIVMQSSYAAADRDTVLSVVTQAAEEVTGTLPSCVTFPVSLWTTFLQ